MMSVLPPSVDHAMTHYTYLAIISESSAMPYRSPE
jgi:hypothetical protein